MAALPFTSTSAGGVGVGAFPSVPGVSLTNDTPALVVLPVTYQLPRIVPVIPVPATGTGASHGRMKSVSPTATMVSVH